LNYNDLQINTIKTLITGSVKTNGQFMYNKPFSGVWENRGVFESTKTTGFQIWLAGGGVVTGGKFICNLPYNANTSLFFNQNPNSKYCFLKNANFYNSGITANSTQGNPIIRYSGSNVLWKIESCNFSGTAGNTNTSTQIIKPEGDNTSYSSTVEGNYCTQYHGTIVTNLTLNADVDVISNLQF